MCICLKREINYKKNYLKMKEKWCKNIREKKVYFLISYKKNKEMKLL